MKLLLTSRAMDDLWEIYNYSQSEWGSQVADNYITSIEKAFTLIKENQNLLRVNPKISNRFMIYYARKPCLVCDVINDSIVVLTIKHISMNLLERLNELEPNLNQEAIAMYKRAIRADKNR